jgi:hypothetical protein
MSCNGRTHLPILAYCGVWAPNGIAWPRRDGMVESLVQSWLKLQLAVSKRILD